MELRILEQPGEGKGCRTVPPAEQIQRETPLNSGHHWTLFHDDPWRAYKARWPHPHGKTQAQQGGRPAGRVPQPTTHSSGSRQLRGACLLLPSRTFQPTHTHTHPYSALASFQPHCQLLPFVGAKHGCPKLLGSSLSVPSHTPPFVTHSHLTKL